MEADISYTRNENTVNGLDKNFSDLLLDVHRQVQHSVEEVDSCLRALNIGSPHPSPGTGHPSMTATDDISHPHNPSVLPATMESMSFIPEWCTEYANCHKSHKQHLRQTDDIDGPLHPSVGDTSLTTIHDLDSPLALHDSINSAHTNLSLAQLPSVPGLHQTSTDTIANQWTLNNDQRRAYNIMTNHACETSEKTALKMLLTGPVALEKPKC